MGREVGFDIHYVIIFWQFTCCKRCFQAQMRVKVFLGLYCCHHSKPPSCFWNEPHLLTNASLCSDSSQYAIFSQSLIRFIRSLHLDLKHKRCPNDWGGSKWMCSKKARKKRNKQHFTTSCIQYIHLYLSYVLYFVIFSLFFSSQDVLYMKNDLENVLHLSMQNYSFVSGCGDIIFPKNVSYGQRYQPGSSNKDSRPCAIFLINRTQMKSRNHLFLKLQISTVCLEN